jgi:hypothetical protein
MLTSSEATLRVQQGARFLDGVYPGWWKKIDLEKLALDNCDRCVLGQISGRLPYSEPCGYVFQLGVFGWSRDVDLPGRESPQVRYGFTGCIYDIDPPANLEQSEHMWEILRNAWIAEIEQRRIRSAELDSILTSDGLQLMAGTLD